MTLPEERDVVVVGGGIAAIEALMALADLGDNRLRVHLVADQPTFTLPPEALGVPWERPVMHVDLELLCRGFGARFTQAEVIGIDADAGAHAVFTAGRDTVHYDQLLLAPGARRTFAYPGTTTVGFGELPSSFATDIVGSVAVVIPDGVTWTLPAYQLALLASGGRRDHVRVLTGEQGPAEAFGTGTQAAIRGLLERHGVTVETDRAPAPETAVDGLADHVAALPLLAGPTITGIPYDANGWVPVDTRGAVHGLSDVRAVGDCTNRAIKQGGLAAQQADLAAAEIVRDCGGDPVLSPYEPVLRGRLLAPGGEALYLRRALDGLDPGRSLDTPLWQPESAICAWRLARWLNYHQLELDQSAAVR